MHAAHAAGVVQLTGDEVLGDLSRGRRGRPRRRRRCPCLSSEAEALVDVHAGAVDALDRLRHEGRVQAVLLGDRLQHVLEGRRPGRRSAMASPYSKSISCWPMATSWWLASTSIPMSVERVHHVLADGGGQVGGEVEVAARGRAAAARSRRRPCRRGRTPAPDRSCRCSRARPAARAGGRARRAGSPGKGSPFGL